MDVYQTVNGFGVFNRHNRGAAVRVRIEQSYCHHLAYYSPEPGQEDNRTHNDCVQIQGGSGAIVRYNRLHEIAINGGPLSSHASTDFLGTLHRNRFNRDQFFVGHTIDLHANVRADTGDGTANRNVYTDGTPVTVRHNAGNG